MFFHEEAEYDVLEDFAGPGGWDEGVVMQGRSARILGREIDHDAVATARAAGHIRKQVSVLVDDPAQYKGATGYVASPPCQTFTTQGKGAGRGALIHLAAAARLVASGVFLPTEAVAAVHDTELDERSVLVLEPLRVIHAIDPDWVAMEQVPNALPIFQVLAALLDEQGYRVRTEVVSAEEYGVGQARRRCIFVAVKKELAETVPWPAKTHSKYHVRTPDRLDPGYPRWVSMGEACGWAEQDLTPDRPGRWARQSDTPFDHLWPMKRPSTVVAGRDLVQHPGATRNATNGSTKTRNDGILLSAAEAGMVQSFRKDYPWQGKRSSQHQRIGDAIPPLLAGAVLAPLLSLVVQGCYECGNDDGPYDGRCLDCLEIL